MEVLYELGFNWENILGWDWIPAVLGCAVLIVVRPLFKYDARKLFVLLRSCAGIAGTVLILLSVYSVVSDVKDYSDMKKALENGQALEVEGYVENYHPMPREGHDTERFDISGVHFEYSNFILSQGYNLPASYGGVIHGNGQHLLIRYVSGSGGSNTILYIAELE